MKELNMENIKNYVEDNIAIFHKKRLESVSKNLNLDTLLEHKNPYLFKAKNIFTAQALVKGFVDAFLQSQEEAIFGDFIEGLAIFICNEVYGAVKMEKGMGMDMQFEKDGIIYAVEIKAGWNWGNSSQIKQIKLNAKNIKEKLEKETGKHVIVINGCCFGKKKNNAEKAGYIKICGQDFWGLISNDDDLYIKIIEPIGYKAKQKNEEFEIAYSALLFKITLEFANRFCNDGIIDWEKLLKFNSGRKNDAAV